MHTVLSGPAAGAIAAAQIGVQAGYPNLVACDMGGTSFDVSLIAAGEAALSAEKDIAYGVPLRVPLVDIHTIGAGGGSIARITRAGLLQVGPESAGARPGPIAYGRGGTAVTVTDANLLLGRLNPDRLTGVEESAPMETIATAIHEQIGAPLGLDATGAAAAVLAVTTNQLAHAIRLVSVEKGHDPRDFALFAFGGAGPLHAVEIARELGIPTVLVPRFPGITSGLGCVLAPVRHDFVQSIGQPLADAATGHIDGGFANQAAAGRRLLDQDGVPLAEIVVRHEVDLLFRGQSHVFRVPVTAPGFDPRVVLADFLERYKARFDIELPEMTAILVNLGTTVIGRRAPVDLATFAPLDRRVRGGPAERRAAARRRKGNIRKNNSIDDRRKRSGAGFRRTRAKAGARLAQWNAQYRAVWFRFTISPDAMIKPRSPRRSNCRHHGVATRRSAASAGDSGIDRGKYRLCGPVLDN